MRPISPDHFAVPTALAHRSHNPRHTISSSFSFTIPETWRPKGGIVRWINELPGPKAREEPLEPTPMLGQKHDLEPDNEKTPTSEDHRNKRTRRFSAASFTKSHDQMQQQTSLFTRGHRAVASISSTFTSTSRHRRQDQHQEQPVSRSETAASNYTVVYQQSDYYHHHHHHGDDQQQGQHRYAKDNTSSRRASSTMAGTTARGSVISNSPPGTPLTIPGRARMRFAFVGDSGCGKSSLLL
ncbi:uncharacterized protein B0I36DRAFT_103279 [Microdochium trichocladiopsis]|uniref:Uncharacterized protein n=1 Tax=Microdochium trichocladiopsis TaxID=1682393 RepID=A0A9P9BRM7_9PEZI|nr:uncharacterized protein B0I36DRAFT_103279 [Microdochium trichocladiopsis]KAH7032980.1 hypothetical protein B0I36DRAFT_103279 [Microdochium trichocladiopsis]